MSPSPPVLYFASLIAASMASLPVGPPNTTRLRPRSPSGSDPSSFSISSSRASVGKSTVWTNLSACSWTASRTYGFGVTDVEYADPREQVDVRVPVGVADCRAAALLERDRDVVRVRDRAAVDPPCRSSSARVFGPGVVDVRGAVVV